MRPKVFRPLLLAFCVTTSASACVVTGTGGSLLRTVTAAQRDRDCSLLGVVVGSEPRVARASNETEAAMTQVRRQVLALGGNALHVLSNTTTGEVRTITAEALSCRSTANG